MATDWTDRTKPTTSYTERTKPIAYTITAGMPYGLLLALTYGADVSGGTTYSERTKPTTLYTERTKP